MSLENLANVELPEWGVYKFVLIEVSDGSKSKEILVAGPGRWHRDILTNYSRTLAGLDVQVLGGGRISITDQSIDAYGYSEDFGTAPQQKVEALLSNYIAEKGLRRELKVEMEKGY